MKQIILFAATLVILVFGVGFMVAVFAGELPQDNGPLCPADPDTLMPVVARAVNWPEGQDIPYPSIVEFGAENWDKLCDTGLPCRKAEPDGTVPDSYNGLKSVYEIESDTIILRADAFAGDAVGACAAVVHELMHHFQKYAGTLGKSSYRDAELPAVSLENWFRQDYAAHPDKYRPAGYP